MDRDKIIEIRKDFHRHPELAFMEKRTSQKLREFFDKLEPEESHQVAGSGWMFIYDSKKPGPKVAFRAEMDALPISENNDNLEYKSKNPEVSHVCGHDGHMSIVMKLADYVSENRPSKGKTIFIFQPAEETGQGAKAIIAEESYKNNTPDFVFGLHNIPGYQKHLILLKKENFAAGSKGMSIIVKGKTSHAAEPENGINPIYCIADLVNELKSNILADHSFKDSVFATVIHVSLGEKAFGTSPGHGELHLTLRAFVPDDLDRLTNNIEEAISESAKSHGLKYEIHYQEVFPVLVNNEECVKIIERSAINTELKTQELNAAFKWSEDFAYYGEYSKIGFFGLGSGSKQVPLHNSSFDFPDEIIESGFMIFRDIYQKLCK
jgi:amidohydrolase